MKLFIVLSLLAYGYADKLDRTYLPPASAGTAGGSPGSLIAPGQVSNFGQQPPGFRGSQPGRFGQPSGLAFGSGSPDYPQKSPSQSSGFGQAAKPGLKGPNAGFGRPHSQSGGQATPQGTSYAQPSGSGVNPPRGSFEQSLFGESGFSRPSQITKGFSGQNQQPQRPQASSDAAAETFRYDNQIDGGSFSYEFETSNGIIVEESGVASNGVEAHGEYAYTGDDGQLYKITYTADQNGYLPQGDHLPTPPPIPQEILRSIEKNAEAAAAGTQEGAYNPDDNNPQLFNGAYNPGQILLGGSGGFGPSDSVGFQAKTQRPTFPGSNQGTNQQAFTAQGGNQQGFSGPTRKGQNGSQGLGQIGYDYSRPRNQGSQPSGNTNVIPSSSTKTSGSQNQGRPFQRKNQPSSFGAFDGSTLDQGQYQTPEYDRSQQQPSESFVNSGNTFNRGSQGVTQPNQPSGNQGSLSSFNQNRGFVPTQGSPSFGQNRASHNQGSQASQSQRRQGGIQNQNGYEYNKPQPMFNSGNQGQFRPSSQGPTGSTSQGSFPGPQSPTGFPASTESRPGSVQSSFPGSQSPTGFPGSTGTTRPQGTQGQHQRFTGSGTEGPAPSSPLFEAESVRPTSLKPKIPVSKQTTQTQEMFKGPRQQASFSPEEGYRY